jgi:prepilin-type N-terminal cleavage/methylation domain-containing protein
MIHERSGLARGLHSARRGMVGVRQSRRDHRRLRRGFSLIEAMVAAGVLGIALLGLVRLHTSAMRGTVQADSIGRGAEVARQLADMVASTNMTALPAWLAACGPGPAAPLPANFGCRAQIGGDRVRGQGFAAVKGGCTFFMEGAGVPSSVDPNVAPSLATGSTRNAVAPLSGEFRVDVALSAHPNPASYPNTALVTVWVCWMDSEGGSVREVETRRVLL